MRRFVNLYVNGEDVRFQKGLGNHAQDRRRAEHRPGGGWRLVR